MMDFQGISLLLHAEHKKYGNKPKLTKDVNTL